MKRQYNGISHKKQIDFFMNITDFGNEVNLLWQRT